MSIHSKSSSLLLEIGYIGSPGTQSFLDMTGSLIKQQRSRVGRKGERRRRTRRYRNGRQKSENALRQGFMLIQEKAMAPHSSTFAWKVPWMEGPGRLQSMGSLGVGHNWATSVFTFMHWRRKWQPTPVFLPGESQGRGSLVAAVYGVTQSRTRLKWLSSSSPLL